MTNKDENIEKFTQSKKTQETAITHTYWSGDYFCFFYYLYRCGA